MRVSPLIFEAYVFNAPLFFDERKEICLNEPMKEEQQITTEQLATLITQYHQETQIKMGDLQKEIKDLREETRDSVKELREGMFTAEEKEDLMANVCHINERLEHEALGKSDITLTRSEYDHAALARPFANRFEALTEVGAE